MKIAIVGSGIAGLAAAHALAGHDVTLYEAAHKPGGHVYTVRADGHAIDMGFIVCNRERYPRFFALLAELGIATRPTTMSFSVAAGGIEWGSESLSAMFADRRLLVDRRHWWFLAQVVAFLRRARRDLHSDLVRASLDEYLAARAVGDEVRARFVVPVAAALWSLAPALCGAFPAATYLRFLDQHGMLSPIRPLRWHTIVGGSERYVAALVAHLHARGGFALRLATPISRIEREDGVIVDGERYDRTIVATHADTALRLLAAPTADERRVLGAFRYSKNRTVLHTDRTLLPRRVHAAWNYVADPEIVRVTYSMTRLQGLPDRPYLVTLNPRHEPAGTLHEVTFAHPQFDDAAIAAQAELQRLRDRVYYAGSYCGFGFHEDALRAGALAAQRLVVDAAREAS